MARRVWVLPPTWSTGAVESASASASDKDTSRDSSRRGLRRLRPRGKKTSASDNEHDDVRPNG